MLLRLRPELKLDDANPDSRPRSEDDGNYGSLVEFRSTAADAIEDISDESARYRDKRLLSNASLSYPPTKRT